jgi:hypothetical protein
MGGRVGLSVCLSISLVAASASAQQQMIGAPPEASNMKLVGTNDLQARSAYSRPSIIRASAGSPISAITAAPKTFPHPSIP